MEYKLSDETIAQIAKLVQLAILTGTDVVDNLRLMRVTPSEGSADVLDPTAEYLEVFESNIQKLQDNIAKMNT
ncbi:MAG: hypothetical protein CML56_08115 [Rhodobacteraceae bacterium]|nr:hypothetical protein [Paracoccaceae bacterium]